LCKSWGKPEAWKKAQGRSGKKYPTCFARHQNGRRHRLRSAGTFEHIGFKIIFITAWEKYAIEAFGFSAVDYILKPVNPESWLKQ
jgi:DNA-binding LytR/AlgR family response regulator